MRVIIWTLVVCLGLSSCETDQVTNPDDTPDIDADGSHVKFFGFTLIDTYWDDPTDTEEKTNYADEVHEFTNIADILVVNPTDNLVARTKAFFDYDILALYHLNELFFELADSNGPSGANYNLRSDYAERWTTFITINQSILNTEHIGAFYLGEEPTWNGISYSDLNLATNLIKSDYPTIPVMIVEAYPSIEDLRIPINADWVGFDRYFIKSPSSNVDFQDNLTVLKSKLSNTSQKLVLIMDTHYIDWAHGDFGGILLNDMDDVADDYWRVAQSDSSMIGLIGYFWPNGFDIPTSIGARGMPDHVIAKYREIGEAITGK